MNKVVFLLIISGIVFFGDIDAMQRGRVDAIGESANEEQVRHEAFMRKRQRMDDFEHEIDRAYENARREQERQEALENRPEGVDFL